MKITKKTVIVAMLGLLPLWSACQGDTGVYLSTDKTEITAGGVEFATIVADVKLAGDAVDNGTLVRFETTAGSFSQAEIKQREEIATVGGRAQITLYSGCSGTATVTADFNDTRSGVGASTSLTIKFGPPTETMMPVDGTLQLTCAAVNIGALREPMPDIRLDCDLNAQTRDGTALPAAALQPVFRTEAGSLSIEDDPYDCTRKLVYSPRGGASTPRDVESDLDLNEPNRIDDNGLERNPRDGLVTLIAVVDGEESFTDENGNGEFDDGEQFVDSAEPFLDVDDDDERDDDEPYIDTNENGEWDSANGDWDERTKIMAIYKLLWTGGVYNGDGGKTSRIDHYDSTIADGGKLELEAFVLDANMNPVAAFQENNDYLEWNLSSSGDATSNDPKDPPMNNVLGFEFDRFANTERKRWRIVANSFVPPAYPFTVEDGYPGDAETAATSFTVTLQVTASPGPTADGYFIDQITEALDERVQGLCH